MKKSSYQPIYDISKTYDDNLAHGPNKKYKSTLNIPKLNQTYKVLGHTVNSPFGAAASPTGCDSHYIRAMFKAGYDIVTTKTRRSVHFQPNPMKNVVHIVPGRLSRHHDFEQVAPREVSETSNYKTLTLANSFGNNSIDPGYWMPDAHVANTYATEGKLLISSIVGTIQEGFTTEDYYLDFVKTALLAKATGAKAIEINFSCPNVVNEGVLCYDPKAVFSICKLVREAIGKTTLIAKIGYYPELAQPILEELLSMIDPYITAISAINTFAAPILGKNGKQALPGKGRLSAGLSGHAVKNIGLDMTKRMNDFRKLHSLKFQIIGIGGVLTPRDFHDYQEAGADVVMSATGAMWNPNLALEIKASL